MAGSAFVYVTYIRAPQQKLWDALTDQEFNRKFWFGYYQQSTWKNGASWTLRFPDGAVNTTGEILECDAPRRAAFSWFSECSPERKADGESRCSYELEPVGDSIRLTVSHRSERVDSVMIRAASESWPKIIASLKSMLETGSALEIHNPSKG
jgi:uncharacterized protein YndB with AHSA1/START domain